MRRTVSIILAIVFLGIALFTAKYLIDHKKRPKSKIDKTEKTVFVEKVINKTIPIFITTNGNLVAKNKIELYSEVQGVLKKTAKEFKTGTAFKKGEVLIKINSDEFYANLQSQKSKLFNAITAIMPDIKLDFPSEYTKWQSYLNNFNTDKTIPNLPKTNSEKEKFFISGRGITTAYFNVKNLEVKLNKYTLRAPFNGVLTEALVNRGTLIRQGQKLGEFIEPTIYELGVPVKSAFQNYLQIGKTANLTNIEKTKNWTGKVIRINGKVDANTQSIQTFIRVSGKNLREGQYLEAKIQAKSVENALEIPRNLLVDNSKVYIVKNNVLALAKIDIIFENKDSLVIRGLPNGTLILSKMIPGAYSGMRVKIFNQKNKS